MWWNVWWKTIEGLWLLIAQMLWQIRMSLWYFMCKAWRLAALFFSQAKAYQCTESWFFSNKPSKWNIGTRALMVKYLVSRAALGTISERQDGVHMGFPECIDTILNCSDISALIKCVRSQSFECWIPLPIFNLIISNLIFSRSVIRIINL